jgi:hypothetical protein
MNCTPQHEATDLAEIGRQVKGSHNGAIQEELLNFTAELL